MNRWFAATCTFSTLLSCHPGPFGGSVVISPESPGASDDLVASFSEFAEDSDPAHAVSYDIVWLLDGSEVGDLAGSLTVPASNTSTGQTWTVQITPRDDKKSGAPFIDSVEIVNAAPRIVTLRIEPSSPGVDDEIRARSTTTDADDDDVELSYQWYANGAKVGDNSDLLGSVILFRGDSIEVKVTPNDGVDDGEVASASATIQNSIPTIERVFISPTTDASSKSVFTCVPDGVDDADADSVTFRREWFVEGEVVSTDTTLASPLFYGGDRVYCTVAAFDGEDEGEAVRSSVVSVKLLPGECERPTVPADPYRNSEIVPFFVGATSNFAYDDVTGNAHGWCSPDGAQPLAIDIQIIDERYYEAGNYRYLCGLRLIPDTPELPMRERLFRYDLGLGDQSYDHHGFTMPSGSFKVKGYTYKTADGGVVGSCLDRRFNSTDWGADIAAHFTKQDWGVYVGELSREVRNGVARASNDRSDPYDLYDLYRGGYVFGGSQNASKYVKTAPLLYAMAFELDSDDVPVDSGVPRDPWVRIPAAIAVPGDTTPVTGLYFTFSEYRWYAKPLLLGVPQ